MMTNNTVHKRTVIFACQHAASKFNIAGSLIAWLYECRHDGASQGSKDLLTSNHQKLHHPLFQALWTHITESTQRRIWLRCMCWQHTVPNHCMESLTSHLCNIIRTHHFDFDVRFWPISALMSKAMHQSWIQRWVLSVIYLWSVLCYPLMPNYHRTERLWTRF